MKVQEWIEAIANLQAIAQTGLQYGKDAYDGEPVLFPWQTAIKHGRGEVYQGAGPSVLCLS